mgnify:CR=1 FL=1|jgi:hypothetical protein
MMFYNNEDYIRNMLIVNYINILKMGKLQWDWEKSWKLIITIQYECI